MKQKLSKDITVQSDGKGYGVGGAKTISICQNNGLIDGEDSEQMVVLTYEEANKLVHFMDKVWPYTV